MPRPKGQGNLEPELDFKLTERRERLGHKSYDAFDVGVIVGMKRMRASYEEIESATGVFATTAKSIIKRVKAAGAGYQHAVAPGRGRKAQLSEEEKTKVFVESNP
jgi:hypothetical protein